MKINIVELMGLPIEEVQARIEGIGARFESTPPLGGWTHLLVEDGLAELEFEDGVSIGVVVAGPINGLAGPAGVSVGTSFAEVRRLMGVPSRMFESRVVKDFDGVDKVFPPSWQYSLDHVEVQVTFENGVVDEMSVYYS